MSLADLLRRGRATIAHAIAPRDVPMGEAAADNGNGLMHAAGIRSSRDEVLATHGNGDLSLYRKLLQDDQVMPTFAQRRANVVAREWRVDAGGDTPIDQEAADFLRSELTSIKWDAVTYKMLTGIMYGYGVAEAIWRRDGARVHLGTIKVRRAERFCFSDDGGLRLRDDARTPLPEKKFWVFTAGAEDDDDLYGLGLGYYLYWPVWFKRNALRFWAIFLERFSMATVVAKVPSGGKQEEESRLLDKLRAITGGGRMVIPKSVELEILQAMKDSGGDYDRFIARLDAAIAKIVLTQTMTTDQGSSLSQAQIHYKVGQATAKSDADLICESFAKSIAAWLTEWNFPGAKVPTVYRDFGEAVDLAQTAARDQALAAIGWRPTAERVREVYGEGYEYSPPAAPAPAFGAPAFGAASFAAPLPAPADSIDELLANGGWERVIGPEVDTLKSIASRCRSLEELRDALGELAVREPTNLAEALARVMFTARMAGNAAAEPDEGPEAS